MSSRAAASRKRLVSGEEKRPASSKGFFSRSKSATVAPAPLNLTPSAPATTFPQSGRNDSPQSSPYHSEIELVPTERHHARRNSANIERLRDSPYPPSSSPFMKKMPSGPPGVSGIGSAYPSPPHEEFQALRLTPYHPSENASSGYHQQDISYIEASYQPPPPVQASYQPPPPIQTMRVNGSPRSLPNLPGKSVGNMPSFNYPAPPSYPPPLPSTTTVTLLSPSTSPGPSSLSLSSTSPSRNQSPTPTLPTYSSSQLPYTSSQITRPTLQVAIHNSPLSPHVREEYAQYNAGPSYPSPPSPNPVRLAPSPMHILTSLPPESESSSIEVERRPWYRGRGGNHSPVPSPPVQATFQSPQSALLTPSPRFGPPRSISGSSDSSGKSSTENSPTPASGFVFPGSRSVARPKVSKKTNSPAIKVKSKSKSRSRQDSDGDAHSPLAVPNVHVLPPPPPLREQRSNPPIFHPSGNGRPPVITWRDEIVSDTSSSFSDDSDHPRKAGRLSDTSSNRGKPTPIAKPGNSPTTYVFPVSRSRAQPSKVPVGLSLTKKRSRKFSSNTDEDDHTERSRFMGMLMKKKKKKLKEPDSSSGSNTVSSGSEFELDSMHSPPSTADSVSRDLPSEEDQDNIHKESRERANKIKSRIGNYPLDPYDSVLLDNDRHTGELLVRFNPTNSPSFHNYGNSPPMSVLDLGCGQGHWVVDAAIAWKGYGTKVTGYDMVDISKGLLPWAVEQGVTDNIRFVRGNFLKQRLPFSDESFDLVRMSCLALCITSDSWVFVLQEVCRVLMVGGRLELIDDLIFFPYGKAASTFDGPSSGRESDEISVAPRLDITIPSSSFTTFSIYDGETTNPGLGLSVDDPEAENFYELYGMEEEEADVDDDTATINEFNVNSTHRVSPNPTTAIRRRASAYTGLSSRSWTRACATSSDLEALFEHMLLHKFGVSKDPSDFISDLMQEVFGHAREVKTMHITLAPPEVGDEEENTIQGRQNGAFDSSDRFAGRRFGMSPASRRESMGLSKSPGLVLWPSTFIPMDQSEIEIHASKHLRLLLSCKNYLIEHAIEATDDEEIDESSVLEALWEYEGFLRHRFNPPPPSSSSSSDGDSGSDVASIRGSIAESVCSDNREYMWELQSEFGQRFAWQRSASSDRPATPSTPKHQDNTPTTPAFPAPLPYPNSPLTSTSTVGSRLNRSETISTTTTAPMYSREEMTHVRTFRVYEALKMNETLFGTAM